MQVSEYQHQLEAMRGYFQQLSPVVQIIDSVLTAIDAFQQHKLPANPILPLELSDDLILDNVIEYPEIMKVSSYLENLRQVLVENFGIWHVANQQWINDLQRFVGTKSHNLEIMAGNAMISTFLLNTIATDNLDWQGQDNQHPQPWTKVKKVDAIEAVNKYYAHVDNIIMAWAPNMGTADIEVLEFLQVHHFKGNFIVIGEKNGATNTEAFWQNAHLTMPTLLNRHHQPFDFIQDAVYVVKV
ncbi:MAG TPA: SAM-dependent methyltransferase [Candidatus Ligilactobacillus excrementigallinarum]|uniref:SAM-dependent methyltransferase n=1 Tax=Candidatus Ligilactobacillus excrementigallinarum TaxID=2838641 RepID=A0A9D1UXH4_9LACO|nr:SAM-dependent methyltransferase [Candidatus Ligilactobacillus excrementigallinarum]